MSGRDARFGFVGEAAVTAELIRCGADVFTPAFGEPRTDLIAVIGGRSYKVQVKTNTAANDVLCYRVRISYRGRTEYYTEEDFDLLACYSSAHDHVALVPYAEAGRALYLRYGGDSRARSAYDFSVEKTIEKLKAQTE